MTFNHTLVRVITRVLYTLGILVSLATFILHAIPTNWGIFLSAACFVVGGMLGGSGRIFKSESGQARSPRSGPDMNGGSS